MFLSGAQLTLYRYAMDVIRECPEAWEKLITGKSDPNSIST